MNIMSWNTTNACNLYCKHCYRESGPLAEGELNTQEGKKLIDEIAKAGFHIMIFSGGEPEACYHHTEGSSAGAAGEDSICGAEPVSGNWIR